MTDNRPLLLEDARAKPVEPPPPTPQPPSERAYFTEGELLPWKGRWFRVHLNPTSSAIELDMLHPTDASIKRAARTERWQKQHPHATGPRRSK